MYLLYTFLDDTNFLIVFPAMSLKIYFIIYKIID